MILINIKFKDEAAHQLLTGGVKETKIKIKESMYANKQIQQNRPNNS